ncbi:Hypothetical protein R9X50_00306200 [Acrodontium crateriforme]|uniref:Uncharacterized protein n=1 Tax=Acrodontium crateriforme TaxID=150365 RepID=A0AAQ3R754_9PEZI|nr:Hypothetical protein R9X50_00306200 [Acrodontium crateriforme]
MTTKPHRHLRNIFQDLKHTFVLTPSTDNSVQATAHLVDDPDEPFLPFAGLVATSPATQSRVNMGGKSKSNKFDYTNRGSSGTRLGKSIGAALEKEATKLQKDAEKLATQGRKQRLNSATSSTAGKESDDHAHSIDLQAPNKALGDEGVAALADGLENALNAATSLASLVLEDLNLAGNGITTASLARLAPIIELAKHDLKTLNLSDNHIRVQTEEESKQWRIFLVAFKGCFRLRRLDLSGNTELSAKALEIFACVHLNEEAIVPISACGNESVLSLGSKNGDGDDHHPQSPSDGESKYRDSAEFGKDLAHATLLTRRRGLRSIPYITLQGIGLTDAGALWLSYILEDHYYPTQLIDDLNAISPSSSIKTYQQDANRNGIDWEGNETSLGKDGIYLLEKTESSRMAMLDDQGDLEDSMIIEYSDAKMGHDAGERRSSLESRPSRATARGRRFSMRSIHTLDGGEHESSEMESARKRIQRHTIDQDSASSVELWSAALKLVKCARILLFVAPSSQVLYTGECKFTSQQFSIPKVSQITTVSPKYTGKHRGDMSNEPSARHVSRGSYAERLTSPLGSFCDEPSAGITDVTNSPTTPKLVFKPRRKSAFSESTDLPAVTQKLRALAAHDHNPERFIKFQKDRIAATVAGGGLYRDIKNVCHLPRSVVEKIVDLVGLSGGVEAMTESQKNAAFSWGRTRSTLATEMDWRRKDDSSQVWMLLDQINCLAYGQ